jgi:hypothetical protein
MSEELLGPIKSRDSIRMFEDWLIEKLRKGSMKIANVEAMYQYVSGHEPRKIRQYLKAIETGGRIKIYSNAGEKMVALSDLVPKREKNQRRTLAEIIDARMKKDADIKARMKAGPCKHQECPPFTEDSCEDCSGFLNLKNKDWLEEET